MKMINYEKQLILENKKKIKEMNQLISSYLNACYNQVGNHIDLIDQIKKKFSQKSVIDSLFLNSIFLNISQLK